MQPDKFHGDLHSYAIAQNTVDDAMVFVKNRNAFLLGFVDSN
jgi:hypothetical protein